MPHRSPDLKVVSQEFFYSFGLGGGFNYDQIFCHPVAHLVYMYLERYLDKSQSMSCGISSGYTILLQCSVCRYLIRLNPLCIFAATICTTDPSEQPAHADEWDARTLAVLRQARQRDTTLSHAWSPSMSHAIHFSARSAIRSLSYSPRGAHASSRHRLEKIPWRLHGLARSIRRSLVQPD